MSRPKRKPLKTSLKFVVYDVPCLDIFYDEEFNCRGAISPASVVDLSKSIADNGLQFPIIIQPFDGPRGKSYRVVAGHRRFKAYCLLKYETIPAMVRENLNEREASIINFTENIEREDLDILEEAKVIQKLYPTLGQTDSGYSLAGAGKEMKKSARWVESRVRLLKFEPSVQKMFASGRLAKHFIDKLWKLPPAEQIATADVLSRASRKNQHTGKITIHQDKLPEHLRRGDYVKTSRSKAEIMKMMVKLLDASIIGLAPRVGAWCAGYITTEELMEDLRKRAHHYKAIGVEELAE